MPVFVLRRCPSACTHASALRASASTSSDGNRAVHSSRCACVSGQTCPFVHPYGGEVENTGLEHLGRLRGGLPSRSYPIFLSLYLYSLSTLSLGYHSWFGFCSVLYRIASRMLHLQEPCLYQGVNVDRSGRSDLPCNPLRVGRDPVVELAGEQPDQHDVRLL